MSKRAMIRGLLKVENAFNHRRRAHNGRPKKIAKLLPLELREADVQIMDIGLKRSKDGQVSIDAISVTHVS